MLRGVALLALALVTGGCAGSSGGLARGAPTVVTLENLSYDPPRVLGLVSENHPAAQSQEAAIRKSGIKRVPSDRMDALLAELEGRGFVESSAPLASFDPADRTRVLRRLTVTIGEERRAFTLPRGPAKDAAERFNAQALAVQAMFNEVVDFRQEVGNRDPDLFYEVQQRLFDSNRRKLAGRAPDHGPRATEVDE